MIVVDASVVVDLLLAYPAAPQLARRLAAEAHVSAPHLLDAEVGQVLRRHVASGRVPASVALAAIDDLIQLPVTRMSHLPLLERAFELRQNVTFYDALYLALAESLGAELLTKDAALAKVPGAKARVTLIS